MIFLLGLGFQRLQAQDTYSLSGKVTDSLGVGLYPATVQVIGEKDTANTLTREDGSFSLKNLHIRKIRLLVTMKGYRPVDRSMAIADKRQSVQLGTLVLPVDYGELDPVTVTRVRPITVAGDTVSYNTAAFPVRDGSEVEDILKRLPGVEVDINGNVIVQGKIVSKVLVNGKEFFGGDVLLAIQNLPADVVDKLQIIDDYGDKARLTGVKSGESAKVLNIVMKTDKRNGEFGQATLGVGDDSKYYGEAFANAFNGDRQISAQAQLTNNNPAGNNPTHTGGLNYADQWSPDWGGSVNYNNGGQQSQTSGSSVQDSYYAGEQLQQTQTTQNSSGSSNNAIGTTLTYKPANNSTLRFNGNVEQHSSNAQSGAVFTTVQQDSGLTKSTAGTNLDKSHSTGQSVSSTIYYEKLSPVSRRRFSTAVSVNYANNRQIADNLSNAVVTMDSLSTTSLLHYLITNTFPTLSLNLNSTYFLPLGPTSFLELGYRGVSTRSQSNVLTQQPGIGNTQPVTIDSLSQQQVFNTLTQNIHTGLSGHFRCLDLTIGLDGQPGMMSGTTPEKGTTTAYHYFEWIPQVEGAWTIDKTRKINIAYSSHPNLPGLSQLTPFTNVSNPQYPVIGNPDLKPSTTNAVTLHYEKSALQATRFWGYGVSVGYTFTEHTIISTTSQPKANSAVIQQTTYANEGTAGSLHGDYHLSLPAFWDKQFRITTNGSYTINQTPAMTNGLLYTSQNRVWNQSLHLQLLIPDIIETNLEASYSVTHSIYPGSDTLPNVFKTASVSWNTRQYLFNKWIVNYELSQPYLSKANGLQVAPCNFNASIQRQFLSHNKGMISFRVFNILNSNAGVSQSSSAIGITRTNTQYIGRYFFLTFQLKLNRFKN